MVIKFELSEEIYVFAYIANIYYFYNKMNNALYMK